MDGKHTHTTSNEEEISLKELILKIGGWLHYLLSKWLLILLFGILGGGYGYYYAYRQKPVYTATTTFVLDNGDNQGGGMGQYAGLASMVGIDLGGGGGDIFQGDNILELYKSRSMIEKTLLTNIEYQGKKQLLIDCFIDVNKLRETWAKKPELQNINFSLNQRQRLRDSIIGAIVADINVNYLSVTKPDKKLSIINAEVKAKDEIFAKIFNEQIVKNVNDFYVQTKTRKSLENIKILQQKTDSVRGVMNGAINSVAAVADATPNLNPTRQVLRTGVQRAQFNVETNKVMLTQLVQNLEMAKLSLRKETPLIQVIDTPVYPLEKRSFGKLKGIIIGVVFGGFLLIAILTIKKMFKLIMA